MCVEKGKETSQRGNVYQLATRGPIWRQPRKKASHLHVTNGEVKAQKTQ